MRRVAGGNEENLVEAEEVSRLSCNGQVAVVDGVEAASQKTETCHTQGLGAGCEGPRFRISGNHRSVSALENHEVVAVNHFLIFLGADPQVDFCGL